MVGLFRRQESAERYQRFATEKVRDIPERLRAQIKHFDYLLEHCPQDSVRDMTWKISALKETLDPSIPKVALPTSEWLKEHNELYGDSSALEMIKSISQSYLAENPRLFISVIYDEIVNARKVMEEFHERYSQDHPFPNNIGKLSRLFSRLEEYLGHTDRGIAENTTDKEAAEHNERMKDLYQQLESISPTGLEREIWLLEKNLILLEVCENALEAMGYKEGDVIKMRKGINVGEGEAYLSKLDLKAVGAYGLDYHPQTTTLQDSYQTTTAEVIIDTGETHTKAHPATPLEWEIEKETFRNLITQRKDVVLYLCGEQFNQEQIGLINKANLLLNAEIHVFWKYLNDAEKEQIAAIQREANRAVEGLITPERESMGYRTRSVSIIEHHPRDVMAVQQALEAAQIIEQTVRGAVDPIVSTILRFADRRHEHEETVSELTDRILALQRALRPSEEIQPTTEPEAKIIELANP